MDFKFIGWTILMCLLAAAFLTMFTKYGFADELRYNTMEDQWEYAEESAKLRYNPYEDQYEYAKESEGLEYNPMEDQWEFTNEKAYK